MADQVTKTIVEDKHGTVGLGVSEYRHAIIPTGKSIEVVVKVDGVEKMSLGPWLTTAKIGENALVQIRLKVFDDYPKSNFSVAEEVGI